MTEERAAAALSRWLQQPPGGPVPEDVDPDALAAVAALRPEHLPPARVSIDDILAEVLDGPLGATDAERAEAQAYGDALDQDPEDADLPWDPRLAMRPDLAAPPRVALEDILADVRTGPMRAPDLGEAVPTLPASMGELAPLVADEPALIEAANRVPGAPRRRFPAWFWTGASVMVMAALALLVVIPAAKEDGIRGFPTPTASEAPPAPAAPQATMAPAAADDPVAGRPEPAPLIPELAASPAEVGGLAAQGQAPASPAGPADAPAKAEEQRVVSQAAESLAGAAPALDSNPAGRSYQTTTSGLVAGDLGSVAASGGTAAATATLAKEAAEANEEVVILDTPRTKTKATSTPTIAELDDLNEAEEDNARYGSRGDASASDEDLDMTAAPTASRAPERESARPRATKDDRKTTSSRDSAPKSAPATAPAAAPAAEPAPPADGWTERAAADQARLAAADRALAAGQTDAALQMLTPLLGSPVPDSVMAAALRIGRVQLARDLKPEALETVRRGLAVEGSAALRAELLTLQAQITTSP